jgi:peptide/nickel transport system ATP-binding protein
MIRALDGINFEVDDDDALALIGESGCGKSTLAHTIMKLLPDYARIESGQVLLNGRDLMALGEVEYRKIRYKEIAIIFQGAMNMLNPVIRVEDQIAEVIIIHEKASKKEAVTRAWELLEMVGISPSRGKNYPHELSGGQKQRVVIAIALACNPKLIISDEPFTALDVMVQAQLIELMKEIRSRFRTSLILITHDLSVTGEMCKKVAVLYAGKIVEYGSLSRVFQGPRHPYTQGLLKSIPTIDGPISKLKSIPGNPPDLGNPPPGCSFEPRCSCTMDKCHQRNPELVKVEEGHYAACFLEEQQ